MKGEVVSLRLPLAGYLAAFLWPLLHLVDHNFGEFGKFGFSGIWQIALICLGAAVLGIIALAVLFRLLPRYRVALVTTFTVLALFFFFFSIIHGGFVSLLTWAGATSGAGLGYIAVVLFVIGLVWLWRDVAGVHRFVAAFVIIGCAMPMVGAIGKSLTATETLSTMAAGHASERDVGPGAKTGMARLSGENVYYIIVDGYVGDRNLKTVFNLDNSEFIERMKNAGFYYVEDARSNYIGSATSIASLFHARYFRDDKTRKGDLKPSEFFPVVMNRNPPPHLIDAFVRSGYNLALSESWYSACKDRYFACILDRGPLALNQESQLVLELSLLPRILPKLFAKHVDAVTPITTAVIKGLQAKGKPFFVFAHHMQPHSPWYFDSQCNYVDTDGMPKKDAFRDAVRCVNRTILAFVERVAESDPGAIIVVQGDHGSGFIALEGKQNLPEYQWEKNAMDERSENISFVKAPAECRKWLRPDLGPLNTVRFVLACLRREEPDYLPEKLFVPGPNYDETHDFVRYEGLDGK